MIRGLGVDVLKWKKNDGYDSDYNEEDAESKLGQDIILKAIADNGMAGNVTIEGGIILS